MKNNGRKKKARRQEKIQFLIYQKLVGFIDFSFPLKKL
jgi:hypothetical protein